VPFPIPPSYPAPPIGVNAIPPPPTGLPPSGLQLPGASNILPSNFKLPPIPPAAPLLAEAAPVFAPLLPVAAEFGPIVIPGLLAFGLGFGIGSLVNYLSKPQPEPAPKMPPGIPEPGLKLPGEFPLTTIGIYISANINFFLDGTRIYAGYDPPLLTPLIGKTTFAPEIVSRGSASGPLAPLGRGTEFLDLYGNTTINILPFNESGVNFASQPLPHPILNTDGKAAPTTPSKEPPLKTPDKVPDTSPPPLPTIPQGPPEILPFKKKPKPNTPVEPPEKQPQKEPKPAPPEQPPAQPKPKPPENPPSDPLPPEPEQPQPPLKPLPIPSPSQSPDGVPSPQENPTPEVNPPLPAPAKPKSPQITPDTLPQPPKVEPAKLPDPVPVKPVPPLEPKQPSKPLDLPAPGVIPPTVAPVLPAPVTPVTPLPTPTQQPKKPGTIPDPLPPITPLDIPNQPPPPTAPIDPVPTDPIKKPTKPIIAPLPVDPIPPAKPDKPVLNPLTGLVPLVLGGILGLPNGGKPIIDVPWKVSPDGVPGIPVNTNPGGQIVPATNNGIDNVPTPGPIDPCQNVDPCTGQISDIVTKTKASSAANSAALAAIASQLLPVPTPVKIFVKCENNAPVFGTQIVSVPANSFGYVSALFEKIANTEGRHCAECNAIATVPEWWQLRPEAGRRQGIFVYKELRDDNTIGNDPYAITVPHCSLTSAPGSAILNTYRKGNWQGILSLKDNSKLIVNCIDSDECERVITELSKVIDSDYLVGSTQTIGKHKGKPFKQIRVKAQELHFFPNGAKTMKPAYVKSFF
jgi:hypothetical protein